MAVQYSLSGGVATITMDDAKVNAFSFDLFRGLGAALDRAQSDAAITLLTGRDGIFSAGFHLGELTSSADAARGLLREGAALCTRLLDFPQPVIAACTGHAYPMGAFALMSVDYRVGAAGPFNIGLNEVRINIPVPRFAVEVARGRLHPAWFNRTTVNGEMFEPEEAKQAGFLDEVVAPGELLARATAKAEEFAAIDVDCQRTTKRRVRSPWIAAIESAIAVDLKSELLG